MEKIIKREHPGGCTARPGIADKNVGAGIVEELIVSDHINAVFLSRGNKRGETGSMIPIVGVENREPSSPREGRRTIHRDRLTEIDGVTETANARIAPHPFGNQVPR